MMKVANTMGLAVNGIRQGLGRLEENAKEIAQSADGTGKEVITPLIESRLNQQQIKANVATIGTLDEILGTLLDEKA